MDKNHPRTKIVPKIALNGFFFFFAQKNGRCFSPVGEFLIPARTREKEGEKGKRRREKKEERDMRLSNYEYK